MHGIAVDAIALANFPAIFPIEAMGEGGLFFGMAPVGDKGEALGKQHRGGLRGAGHQPGMEPCEGTPIVLRACVNRECFKDRRFIHGRHDAVL